MIISALVERGADVNIRDRWGSSPLTDAIRVGSLEVARKLIQSGANLNLGLENIQEKSLSNETDAAGWLCELARAGDTLRLSLLLEGNINPDAADYDARTCLHLAASEGQMPVVSALMTSGANANVQDRWGNTPLCDAIREGHTQVARLLRKHGAELLLPDAEASSRLCEHARVGDVEKVKLLLECGCDPDLCDYDNRTCMHLAASEGQHLVIQALVDSGANVGMVDRWGNSPLVDSVREGHLQVCNMLVGQGARLDASSGYTESRSSAELCDLAKAGNLERIKQLALCGVDLNSADYDQRCSLHIAASEGHKHIVEDFLARPEVVFTVTDRWGGTPVDDARRHGHAHVVALFEAKEK